MGQKVCGTHVEQCWGAGPASVFVCDLPPPWEALGSQRYPRKPSGAPHSVPAAAFGATILVELDFIVPLGFGGRSSRDAGRGAWAPAGVGGSCAAPPAGA